MRLPWKKSIRDTHSAAAAARRTAGILLLGLLGCLPVRAQDMTLEGQSVAEVLVVDEAGKSVALRGPALPLETGKPFDFAKERDTVQALYRTGNYADIRVTAGRSSDGLHVDFIVRRNYFNNVVRVEGLADPPSEPAA